MRGRLKRSAFWRTLSITHVRLALVDLAGGTDQPGLLRVLRDDEPGIDGDAMATDAGAGLQDVDARVAVGQRDQLENVDVQPVGDDRQLVGQRDVDVAEGVLGQLRHLWQRRPTSRTPRH